MSIAWKFGDYDNTSQKYREELESMYACYKKIVVFLMKEGLCYEDAQDAAQDTYIEAISYISTLKKSESVVNWLYTIAKRVSIKYIKRKTKKCEYEDSIEDYEDDKNLALAITDDEKIDDTLGVSQKEKLYKSILKLEDKERKVIVLYYICGYGYKEISEILDINHSTVRSISRRSKEKLRRLIMEEELNNRRL